MKKEESITKLLKERDGHSKSIESIDALLRELVTESMVWDAMIPALHAEREITKGRPCPIYDCKYPIDRFDSYEIVFAENGYACVCAQFVDRDGEVFSWHVCVPVDQNRYNEIIKNNISVVTEHHKARYAEIDDRQKKEKKELFNRLKKELGED